MGGGRGSTNHFLLYPLELFAGLDAGAGHGLVEPIGRAADRTQRLCFTLFYFLLFHHKLGPCWPSLRSTAAFPAYYDHHTGGYPERFSSHTTTFPTRPSNHRAPQGSGMRLENVNGVPCEMSRRSLRWCEGVEGMTMNTQILPNVYVVVLYTAPSSFFSPPAIAKGL